MNEIIKITNEISRCERKDIAKQVMSVCRAITPQFYKAMSIEEIKAERLSIELLIADIDNDTIAEMCKRAIINYPKQRSENAKTYFDINYLLQFYKEAFNYVHCDSIELSKQAELIDSHYDEVRGIVFEKWNDGGVEKIIAHIQPHRDGRQYSPKFFQQQYTDLDEDW